jgi:hemerythrin
MNDYPRLGDDALDEEHGKLSQLIEQMAAADPDTGIAALEAVQVCAERHFAGEDLDLREMSDGNSACHLNEHAAVLSSLAQVCDVLLDAGTRAEDKQALLHRLAIQLLNWLPIHVLEMDSAVAMHRSKVRFGGASIRMPQRRCVTT